MSSLVDLPTDALDQIVRLLEPSEMFCLWLTGSHWVRHRLGRQGGWKSLILAGDDYWPYIEVWPRWLLPELFGLLDLRIYPRSPDCLMPSLRPTSHDIQQLPRSLTRFNMGIVDGIHDADLLLLPPTLTHLWLPYNTRISPNGLANLPSSVVSLGLPRNRLICNASSLPRHLVRFGGNPNAILEVTGLSSTLTKLNMLGMDSKGGWPIDKLWAISRHLPHLRKLRLNVSDDQSAPTRDFSFPPVLEELLLSGGVLPRECLHALPETLKTLHMVPTANGTTLDWVDEDLKLLPSELCELTFWTDNPVFNSNASCYLSISSFQYLPRHLKVFKMTYIQVMMNLDQVTPANFPTHHYGHLPRSLTHLDFYLRFMNNVYSENAFLNGNLKGLPTGLKVGLSGLAYCPSKESSEPFEFSQLESISIGGGVTGYYPSVRFLQTPYTYDWAIENFVLQRAFRVAVTAHDHLVFSHLSKQLTWLSISVLFQLEDKHIMLLPDTLQFLMVSGSSQPTLTDECIPALPHDIREVHFMAETNVYGNKYPLPRKIDTLTLGTNFKKVPLRPKFPPFVTCLSLKGQSVTTETVKAMPRFITTLFVDVATLPTSCVAFLPKYLIKLYIPELEIDDKDVHLLPRGLLLFETNKGGRYLTDESACDWPPLLKRLSIPGNFFTLEGIKQLPRTLTSIRMPEASHVAVPDGEQLAQHLGPHIKWIQIGNHHL